MPQKRNVPESCRARPPPIPLIPLPLPTVLVTCPKVPLVIVADGLANCGEFVNWNASQRKLNAQFSCSTKSLNTDALF